jgi:NTE family protein
MLDTIVDALRGGELVPGLSEAELERLAGISNRVDFPAGAELLTADRPNDRVYVIESGIAEVLRVRGKNEERIARVDRGSCLGEMSALAHRPVAMTVRAVTPIRALSFDGAALLRALIEVPRLGANLAFVLIERLQGNLGRRTARMAVVALADASIETIEAARRVANAASEHAAKVAIVDLTPAPPSGIETDSVSLDALATEPDRAIALKRRLSACSALRVVVRRGTPVLPPERAFAVLHALGAHCDLIVVIGPQEEAGLLVSHEPSRFARWVRVGRDPALAAPSPALGFSGAEDGPERRVLAVGAAPPGNAGASRLLDARHGEPTYAASDDPRSVRDLRALARDLAGVRIGFALGAGAARGFAHIGVLERITELGLPIDALVGSSAGAGIGCLWSFGYDGDRIEHLVAELQQHGVRWALPLRSLLSGRRLERHLRHGAAGNGFDEARWPVGIVAVDMYAQRETLFTMGDLPRCVLASSAVPGVYPPVDVDGRWYVDGGVLNPVPTRFVRPLGVDVVVAVDIGSAEAGGVAPRGGPMLLDVLRCSAGLMYGRISEHSRAGADVLLRPQSTERTPGLFGYERGRAWRSLGRDAVDASADALRQLLRRRSDAGHEGDAMWANTRGSTRPISG